VDRLFLKNITTESWRALLKDKQSETLRADTKLGSFVPSKATKNIRTEVPGFNKTLFQKGQRKSSRRCGGLIQSLKSLKKTLVSFHQKGNEVVRADSPRGADTSLGGRERSLKGLKQPNEGEKCIKQ
jgi:hypothetical protein